MYFLCSLPRWESVHLHPSCSWGWSHGIREQRGAVESRAERGEDPLVSRQHAGRWALLSCQPFLSQLELPLAFCFVHWAKHSSQSPGIYLFISKPVLWEGLETNRSWISNRCSCLGVTARLSFQLGTNWDSSDGSGGPRGSAGSLLLDKTLSVFAMLPIQILMLWITAWVGFGFGSWKVIRPNQYSKLESMVSSSDASTLCFSLLFPAWECLTLPSLVQRKASWEEIWGEKLLGEPPKAFSLNLTRAVMCSPLKDESFSTQWTEPLNCLKRAEPCPLELVLKDKWV